jgi:hypothetical protein
MDHHLFYVRFSGDNPHSEPWRELEEHLRHFNQRPEALDEYSWFVISPRPATEVIPELENWLDTKRAEVTVVEVTNANRDNFPGKAAFIERLTAHKPFPNLMSRVSVP